jgi:hypothetical protein
MVAGSVQNERRKRRFFTSKNLETACRLHGGMFLCGGLGDDLKRIAGSAENFLKELLKRNEHRETRAVHGSL